MGSVEPYETAGGRRYRVRYRDPDRKSKEKGGFARKKDAEEYLATVTVSTARGEYVDPAAAKLTIDELGACWLALQTHLKASTYRVQEQAWRIHVQPVWGHRRVGEIKHSEIAVWVSSYAAGEKQRSATVVIRAFGVLASILDIALKDRRIQSNPARGIKMPRKEKKRRAYLTAAQVELFASECGEHATLVHTLAYTGIRWGEAIGMRISSLDTLRRRMLIQENAVRVGSQIVVGTPKSHERRSVSYPPFLSAPLARQCEGKKRDQLVFGDGTNYLPKTSSDTGWFVRAVKRCQERDVDFPFITPHDLRHTAASLAISAGANPKAVQRMLGHASAAMTLDTYADLFEDDLDAVSERLDSVRAQAVVGDVWGLSV